MANIVKFSKEFLTEELLLPYDNDNVVKDEITGTTRWSVIHDLIFEHEGKYWSTRYSVGATEMQDEEPWRYQNEIKCTEVHQVEKLVKVWEEV